MSATTTATWPRYDVADFDWAAVAAVSSSSLDDMSAAPSTAAQTQGPLPLLRLRLDVAPRGSQTVAGIAPSPTQGSPALAGEVALPQLIAAVPSFPCSALGNATAESLANADGGAKSMVVELTPTELDQAIAALMEANEVLRANGHDGKATE